MVNTENTKLEQISNSPITDSMCRVVTELLHILTVKLVDENGLEVTNRVNNQAQRLSIDKLGEFFTALDKILCVKIVSQFASFSGINHLHTLLADLEDRFRKLLVQNIYKYLNVVSSLPPQSTYCSELLQHLNKNSPFFKGGGSDEQNPSEWGEAWFSAQKKWGELATTEFSLTSLEAFEIKNISLTLSTTCISLVNYLENLLELIKEFAKSLENASSNIKLSQVKSVVTMKSFEEYQAHNTFFKESMFEVENHIPFGKMRAHVFQGKLVVFLQLAEKSYQQILSLLNSITDMEATSTCTENIRSLKIENYLYIQSLTAHLMGLGESPREVEKLVNALFDYASKNNTSCMDLIDEEVHSLNACINRESLAKARLVIRLSDTNFPLSVTHKDTILQATR